MSVFCKDSFFEADSYVNSILRNCSASHKNRYFRLPEIAEPLIERFKKYKVEPKINLVTTNEPNVGKLYT